MAAIVLEVCGSTIMKWSQSWTFAHGALLGLCLMWLAIGVSYYLLAVATTGLPVGVAFAFWESLGLTLVTAAGIIFLAEPITLKRFLGLVCVLLGAWLVHHGTSSGTSRKHG